MQGIGTANSLYRLGHRTLDLPVPYNKKITILADGVKDGKKYIKSLKIDGRPVLKPFISHNDLVTCDELVFEMSDSPTEWGK